MSTKSSIACNDDYHLYQECFENDNVWLRIDNAVIMFDSATGTATVGIPIATWRSIVDGWKESHWAKDESLDNNGFNTE
jgi:hypothetical protein